MVSDGTILVIACFTGIAVDCAAIGLLRRLIRWQTQLTSAVRIYIAAITILAFSIGITVAPLIAVLIIPLTAKLFSWRIAAFLGDVAWGIMVSSLTNLAAWSVGAWFFLMAGTLLLHRILWPLFERPLYRLARIGVFKTTATRSALFVLGLSSMTAALGGPVNVGKTFIKLFASA
jgi:hypothetical protein